MGGQRSKAWLNEQKTALVSLRSHLMVEFVVFHVDQTVAAKGKTLAQMMSRNFGVR